MRLTANQMERFHKIRRTVREHEGAGGQCGFVAEIIHGEYGWEPVSGVYLSRTGEPIGDHSWNVLPDGSILDATADQFCEGNDVRLIGVDDPEHARYRLEWSEDYNPGMADRFPELAGVAWGGEYDVDAAQRLRNERGQGWWLDDPSAHREWDPVHGYDAWEGPTYR